MSKTFKYSPADKLTHRKLNQINGDVGKPVKKVIHHRERRAATREVRTAAIEHCTSQLDCQCGGCVEFWKGVHAANPESVEVQS